jgi:hypothetical protein
MNIFTDDDDGFQSWLRNNPEGFFSNYLTQGSNPFNYPMLHSANCCGTSRMNTSAGYSKACSVRRDELEQWCLDAHNKSMTVCKCKPRSVALKT